jgi:hypothetical protein
MQIDSEIPLPELLPSSNGSPDVHIRYGDVPTALPDPLGRGGYFQATAETLLLGAGQIARYLVVKGQEIVIERLPNCRDESLRLLFIGLGLRRTSAVSRRPLHPTCWMSWSTGSRGNSEHPWVPLK